jgi:uncharacterized protein YkwD
MVLLLLPIMIVAPVLEIPPVPKDADNGLSAMQRREVADLVARFRHSRQSPQERTQAIERALEMGGPAPAILLDAVERELRPLQGRYQVDLLNAARAMLAKARAGDVQEIESLRKTFADLRADPNLTQRSITAKAGPALKRLGELLLVDREAVLKEAPALQARRTELLDLGKVWQRLSEAVAKAGPKADGLAAAPPRFEDVLRAEEETCLEAVLAPDDEHRRTLLANVNLEPRLQVEEARGIRDLNRMRLLAGLNAFRIDTGLCDAARDHCKDMVTRKFFAHDSPVPGKKTPWDRAKNFGTTADAENITGSATTGAEAIQSWFHSPGHFKNMFNNDARIGLGNYGDTWTLMLGG